MTTIIAILIALSSLLSGINQPTSSIGTTSDVGKSSIGTTGDVGKSSSIGTMGDVDKP